MVLDGAFDPQDDTVEEEYTTQAVGFEKAFHNWVEWCEKESECDFQDDDVVAKWNTLYDRLDKASAESSKGREINHEVMMKATKALLYSRSSWTYLGSALQQARDGELDELLKIADWRNDRQDDGTYLTSRDSHYLIYCASGFEKKLPADPESLVKKLKEVAPWYSRSIDTSDFDEPWCEDIFKGFELFEISYKGAAPIMIVGGENDPATPFRWSQEMSANMGTNASLVKFTGEGHSQILESKCVNAIASDTFRFLEVPKSGFTCDVNKPVLKPIWWSNIPPNAMPGEKLNSKVLAQLIDLNETDAYAEFRAVPGDIDTIFSRIYNEFKAADYETDCDPKSAPLIESCFFWAAEDNNIGMSFYFKQDVKDWGLVAPDGPVPLGMNLITFYYWP